MVRFIKVVNAFDKVIDCIPIASSIKNAGILLYQRIHKVNKVANPVNTSWKDDIKIHVLSKDDFIARIAMIPVIGNLTALSYHLSDAIDKARGMWLLGPKGYLAEATRAFSWSLKKHNLEVVALYLARNPNRPEEKLKNALRFALVAGKEEIVKLILDSRTTWSSDSIEYVLKFAKDTKTANIILEKYSNILTDKQAGSVLSSFAGRFFSEDNSSLIKLLLTYYPNIDITGVSRGLENAAGTTGGFNIVCLLLDRFPKIEETYMANALENASKEGFKDTMEVLLKKSPTLVTTHLDELLEKAADRGDGVILNWLHNTYQENITPASIGKVLAKASKCLYLEKNDKHFLIINELLKQYPNLPGKDLEPALERAAFLSVGLFKFYLEKFSQLQPENLQKILNEAVYIYGKPDVFTPTYFIKQWNKVAQLIKEKFPEMEAVNP